jgi:hypothetical protein
MSAKLICTSHNIKSHHEKRKLFKNTTRAGAYLSALDQTGAVPEQQGVGDEHGEGAAAVAQAGAQGPPRSAGADLARDLSVLVGDLENQSHQTLH